MPYHCDIIADTGVAVVRRRKCPVDNAFGGRRPLRQPTCALETTSLPKKCTHKRRAHCLHGSTNSMEHPGAKWGDNSYLWVPGPGRLRVVKERLGFRETRDIDFVSRCPDFGPGEGRGCKLHARRLQARASAQTIGCHADSVTIGGPCNHSHSQPPKFFAKYRRFALP